MKPRMFRRKASPTRLVLEGRLELLGNSRLNQPVLALTHPYPPARLELAFVARLDQLRHKAHHPAIDAVIIRHLDDRGAARPQRLDLRRREWTIYANGTDLDQSQEQIGGLA